MSPGGNDTSLDSCRNGSPLSRGRLRGPKLQRKRTVGLQVVLSFLLTCPLLHHLHCKTVTQITVLARMMHKFSTAPTPPSSERSEEIIRRAAPPTRKRVPPTRKRVPPTRKAGALDPQAGALARGATHSCRRFRRFVTRTYASSGLENVFHGEEVGTLLRCEKYGPGGKNRSGDFLPRNGQYPLPKEPVPGIPRALLDESSP